MSLKNQTRSGSTPESNSLRSLKRLLGKTWSMWNWLCRSSPATLCRCVGVFVVVQRRGVVSTLKRLAPSHVCAVLEGLPADQSGILTDVAAGCRLRSIAKREGVSYGAVKTRLYRARARLREALDG